MSRLPIVALALVFAAAHALYLPPSLGDIDSVNFALGVRDFDVDDHRPHPPGYPVYIGLAKAAVALTARVAGDGAASAIEARALAALAGLAGALAFLLMYRLFTTLRVTSPDQFDPPWRTLDGRALGAASLAAACPLYWYMSGRPMSDTVGLAAALAAQALLAAAFWRQRRQPGGGRHLSPDEQAASGRLIVLGAFVAAVAVGVRSQALWLTMPLLGVVLADRIGRGVAVALVGSVTALAAGVVLWAVPMLVASGGPAAYLAALGSQAGEDFAAREMLYVNPSPRLAGLALVRTFLLPWESPWLGGLILGLAVIGGLVLAAYRRRALAVVLAIGAPYLVFHLLFQDTSFVRYALPLVPPVAFLAVTGLGALTGRAAPPLAGALAAWSLVLAGPVLATYASETSPSVRALAAMHARSVSDPPGVLAMHQTFRRPLEAEVVRIAPQLPSPPRLEWLELARYWREGNTKPVWFLADPRRTDLALIDPQSRRDWDAFDWHFESRADLGGMRPTSVRWHRLPPPGWFAEEGWALTPETAGMARVMGRGPHLGPITARVRRRPGPVRVLVGGRHLGAPGSPPVRFAMRVDGRDVGGWEAPPGFFQRVVDLPPGALSGEGPFAALTLESAGGPGDPIPTSVEQFDVQDPGTLMWAYGEGWHEAEYDPRVGLWRWTSDRASLTIIDGAGPVRLRLVVAAPDDGLEGAPEVTVSAGERVLHQATLTAEAVWTIDVPAEALALAGGRLTIATDRTFVPVAGASPGDHRELGVRVFEVAVEPLQAALR